MTYYAFYKCRLCGEVFESRAGTSDISLVTHWLDELRLANTQHPLRVCKHVCNDRDIGLADFLGFKGVKE